MRALTVLLAASAALGSCAEKSPAPGSPPPANVEGAWIVDKDKSRIEFSGTQTGKRFTGVFERFDAVIVFDPADLASARIEAFIDTSSAKTGDRQRDSALPGAEWFSSKTFPQARFTSTSVTAKGDNAYEAAGALLIRDIEWELTLPFALTIANGRATADGALTLDRADFGIGQGEEFLTDKWVGYDVDVTVHIEAVR